MDEQYLKDLLVALAKHLRDSCDIFLAEVKNQSKMTTSQASQDLVHSLKHVCNISYQLTEIDKSLNEIQDSLNQLSIDLDEQ